ncbi:hypothetical protein BJF78_32910 [Pseudonocardia sp. CNS-139]|nr:hypothetical protein BJF78_32910 [Pseudonocardia sp. CNS-139]
MLIEFGGRLEVADVDECIGQVAATRERVPMIRAQTIGLGGEHRLPQRYDEPAPAGVADEICEPVHSVA